MEILPSRRPLLEIETLTQVDGSRRQATDPTNLATASPNIAYTKIRFVLAGQASGMMIHMRVAYQDSSLPEGHGPWSAWVGGTAK